MEGGHVVIVDGAAIEDATGRREAENNPRAYLLACYPQATIPPLDHVVRTAAPLVARINHGIWIASCSCGARGLPTPGCVVFLNRLVGWCVRCGNQASGHGWRPVAAPSLEERTRIEAVLMCRPRVEDRNWEPGERVADLIAQNREHGDPVPPDDEPPPSALAPMPTGPRWPSEAGRALLRTMRRRRW